MHHDLKTWPTYFEAIWVGQKNFEVRENDRGFRAGDTVTLREWLPVDRKYTGRVVTARISYVTAFGQRADHCVFALQDIQAGTDTSLSTAATL